MSEYIILSIFLFLGAFIAAAATITGLLLGYRTKKSKNKEAPYECGMETYGNARIQFKVGYYIFALLFLVFDVEALFLLPVFANFKEIMAGNTFLSPVVVVIDLVIFLAILIAGLLYAWKKGVLKWE
ncbi:MULTISPECIES: NADH-quinone oxidoreductase subunit A [unclassified Fibrobacter]|uniref:NADH-quinone oxidoreductase subunit A n=1 Tax=unclassified Fibrobacter TaxID=2634177 RepID=UPI000D6AFA82|nr:MULTISPECIES: NADH-quinone oxidoreductase subunit A [unclassified Fibrobacter]PWJ71970.1 NADH dehydrogenase subunit A [Fibrobacter sp. UWR4]PZW70420.1 NADH dehydrogenase subunit A [Fibrobacter sp. UWR1]